MNFIKSFDNTENSSSIVQDVLEQIKKKSEEISTSDASYKLLQSLSNPTNLTNPQIINTLNRRKKDENRFILPALKSRRMINTDKYNSITNKYLVRSNSNILSRNQHNSFISDPFDIKSYKNFIEKAENDLLENEEKKILKRILEKYGRSQDDFINNNNIPLNSLKKKRIDKSLNYDEIWEKLKKSQSFIKKKKKDVRINFLKFIPRKQMIEKCNNIRLLYYNKNNKNERFKKYLSIKNMQMKSTDNIIKKLENSKDLLGDKYNEKYKSYIHFLNQTYEEENLKNDDIIKVKNNIIHEINKLQRQIDKLKNTKKIIIDWIYLLISVKEKRLLLPNYYKYIIEDNIPYENINLIFNNRYHLNINDYYRILNYKNQTVYETADDFIKDLDKFQMNSLNKLDIIAEIVNENNNLKSELDELKLLDINWQNDYNEKYKQLSEKHNYLKEENTNLEMNLIKIKSQKKPVKKYKDKILLNKLAIFAKFNSNNEGSNFFLKNDKSTLFYISICLYYILKTRNFPKLNSKKFILDFQKSDVYNMLIIFQYAEDALDILNKERQFYLSKKESREIYQKIKAEFDKEAKKERLGVKIEMRKKQEEEKIELFKQKLNKKYIKKMRKIDFDYYRKLNRNKNKSLDMEIKRETKFEDFFYDI